MGDRNVSACLPIVNHSAVLTDCGGLEILWNFFEALRAFNHSGSEVTNDALVATSERAMPFELLQDTPKGYNYHRREISIEVGLAWVAQPED